MQYRTIASTISNFFKNGGEVKFGFIQVTTRCNARCIDRCNIWASKPFDMPLEDVKFAIDVFSKNGFSILYLTGGETGLYPYLVEAVEYAKKKGMITSLTSNGTIEKKTLEKLSRSLDTMSISVDHYDEDTWDRAKNVAGISKKAIETIKNAKDYGIALYAITFLNPEWNVETVEKIVHFVNNDLGISFALSYPYDSSNGSTFDVGANLKDKQSRTQRNLRNMVAKVLEMKLAGADVATVSCYMKDVLRNYNGAPMIYPCNAGNSILIIDCNLDAYACYKKEKLFNLRERKDLNRPFSNNSVCDNRNCLINCFKEASLASKKVVLKAVAEEFFSNPKFYRKIIRRKPQKKEIETTR